MEQYQIQPARRTLFLLEVNLLEKHPAPLIVRPTLRGCKNGTKKKKEDEQMKYNFSQLLKKILKSANQYPGSK